MRSQAAISVFSLLIAIFNSQSISGIEYRLSSDVFPLNYNITIRPYFLPEDGDKRFTFYGETSIIINTRKSGVREFAVHADYLHFIEVNMRSVSGKETEFTTDYEASTDKLIFQLKEDINSFVNHTLSFKYTGRISNGYDGLYRISYLDAEDKEKWMVATQLQRIDARKVFPCFDEPGFKAYFNMHISRPKEYNSFSNTVLLKSTIDEFETDHYVDHFDTTPYMSTYLVAIVVSEFIPRTKNNLSIIARPEYYNKTELSYTISSQILSFYNQLFGIPYAVLGNPILQKASLSKFIHNGMENWGLMIYKDEVLIFEDGNTDVSGLQYTTTIISHETSHNWFGNSITFEWWGYFWLNEGFARYYQYFATHKIYPQYELNKQFVVDQLQYILNNDAVNSTQPLSEPNVASPSELARKFSSITYVKGASVIRMISNAMSETYFEMAIRAYIKNNLNRSVNPSHLLKYLQLYWPSSPRVDVEEFFYDWTEQVGFPLLTVTLADDDLSVKVEQKRYLAKPGDGSDPNLRYTIPLTYTTNLQRDFNNTYPSKYFNKDQDEISFKFTEPVQWVMFNLQQTSYYRVMYNISLWYKLHYALCEDNWSGIHEINRAQFIDDLLVFANDGLMEYDVVFKLLEYLETETHYIPWLSAFDAFSSISTYLTLEEHIDFGKYILDMTKKVFNKLSLGVVGNAEKSVLDIYNWKQVMKFNCKYGRRACILDAERLLHLYLNNVTLIQVDMRSTVYCNGLRDGTEKSFDQLYLIFKSEKVLREKLRMRNGLGCVRNLKNMEKYFNLVLGDDVPVGDKQSAMGPLYKENPENVWPTYLMVTSRVDEVAEALESWSNTADLISSIAGLFTTKNHRDKFKEFIDENREKFGTSAKTLDNALQNLDSKLEWSARRLEPLRKYFALRNSGPETSFKSLFVLFLVVLLYVF